MPISKDVNGVIQLTPMNRKDLFDQTGVAHASQFSLCDDIDLLKQVVFDTSAQTSNTTLTVKSGAIASNITLTLPASSGTLALSGAGTNAFQIMQPDHGTSPTASSPTDTLTLTSADATLSITGNASTKTVSFVVNPDLVLTNSLAVNKSSSNSSALYVKALGAGDNQCITIEASGGASWWLSAQNSDLFFEKNGGAVSPWIYQGQLGVYGGQRPRYNLDVMGEDPNTSVNNIYSNNVNATSNISNTSGTVNNFSALTFTGTNRNSNTSVDSAVIGVHEVHTSGSESGRLGFCTRNAGGTLTEQFSVTKDGFFKFTGGSHSTGSGAPLLGTNCPASTVGSPNTWLNFKKSDGTTCYVPAWV